MKTYEFYEGLGYIRVEIEIDLIDQVVRYEINKYNIDEYSSQKLYRERTDFIYRFRFNSLYYKYNVALQDYDPIEIKNTWYEKYLLKIIDNECLE